MKEFMSVLGAVSISVLIFFSIWPQIFAIWLQISGQHFVHFCLEFVPFPRETFCVRILRTFSKFYNIKSFCFQYAVSFTSQHL